MHTFAVSLASSMDRIVKIFAIVVVALSVLSLTGFVATELASGKRWLGPFSEAGRQFFAFPGLVATVVTSDETRGIPRTYLPLVDGTEDQNETINQLDYDLYGVLSRYDAEDDRWVIDLQNFRDGEIIHSWFYGAELYDSAEDFAFSEAQVKHGLPLADSSLIVYSRETANLLRLNADSEVLWHNDDYIFHHSIAVAANGDIWACASLPGHRKVATKPMNFIFVNSDGGRFATRDDVMLLLDPDSGEELQRISLTELLIRHGLAGIVFGVDGNDDPIHLNDIEPALSDGPYWRKDDLFVSIRNRSIVLHYRPETDEIIRLIQGPFVHQHDVDIASDSTLSLFNNNYARIGGPERDTTLVVNFELQASNITVYDYARDSFYIHPADGMSTRGLHTMTGGLHHTLDNGDLFVDLDDFGRVVVFRDGEIIYRTIFPTGNGRHKHITNWTRVYTKNPIKS
ncbi:MAG: arylsulfotransferase family protein [Lewinella sp.]